MTHLGQGQRLSRIESGIIRLARRLEPSLQNKRMVDDGKSGQYIL